MTADTDLPENTVTTAVADVAPADTIWHADLAPDLGAFVQAKGWRSAGDVVSSYRHLERLVGGERIAVPAADADEAAWAPVWDRLGRPRDAAGYVLAAPESGAYDTATADWFRATAHRIGLTASQAQVLHDEFLSRLPQPQVPDSAPEESGDAAEPPEAALRAHWGRRYETNMASARRGFAAVLDADSKFHDVADALGETALMEMLAKIGRLVGEDSITSRADGGGDPRSPAEALAEIARLQRAALADNNHPYVSKTHPDHQTQVKRMEALYALAYGGS